jgi:PAS domain S-box-containing protein
MSERASDARLRPLSTDRRWLVGLAALLALMTIGVMATAALGSSVQTGVRAFVGGEGSWSKAQKNAVIHLQRYLATGRESDWATYTTEIGVTLGDRQARLELEKPTADMTVVTDGFLAGRIAADDIPAMAMVFRTFRRVSYIDRAIAIWTAGDSEIERLDAIAVEIRGSVATADPALRDRLADELEAANDRLTVLEADFSATLGEGARWVQGVLLVVMASILAVLVAISAILGRFMVGKLRGADRQAAETLRASEARLRLLVDHLPAVAWTTDRDLIITSMTGDGLARLGIDGAALTGQSLAAALDEPDRSEEQREASARAHDDALAGRPASYRTTLAGRILQVHVEPLQVAGRTIGVIGVGLDLTDRLELEARLERSTRLESIGRLAGGVAHDFNNLLTAITGYAELIADRLPKGEERHDIEEIQRAAQRATSLTGQLLTFGRRAELRPELVQPNDIIDQMHEMLGRLIGADVDLALALDPSLPNVMADPGQLEQVILNLAVNGADAMPNGGRLTIETAPAVMPASSGRAGDGQIEAVAIRVRDSGSGMDAPTQARIFEPFYTTKGRGKGTGLGLSTVYGIVEQTGGTIQVTSAPGRGSTFTVLLAAAAALPAVAGEAGEAGADRGADERASIVAAAAPPARSLPVPGAPMPAPVPEADAEPAGVAASIATAAASPERGRGEPSLDDRTETRPVILVAEDETSVRELVVHILTTAGYTVVAASDGREALRVADRQPWIDGVVSDVIMPHVNGPQLVAALREHRPGLPVLYMSGFTGGALDERAAVSDDVDLLGKPFKPGDLVARVRAMLGDGVEPSDGVEPNDGARPAP